MPGTRQTNNLVRLQWIKAAKAVRWWYRYALVIKYIPPNPRPKICKEDSYPRQTQKIRKTFLGAVSALQPCSVVTMQSDLPVSGSRRKHGLNAGPASLLHRVASLSRLCHLRRPIVCLVLSIRTTDAAVALFINTSLFPLRRTMGRLKVLESFFHALQTVSYAMSEFDFNR